MKYNFDFNKTFYKGFSSIFACFERKGVGYLSGFQEYKLKQQLDDSITKINFVSNGNPEDEIVPVEKDREVLEGIR
jgi:hypothetical protein